MKKSNLIVVITALMCCALSGCASLDNKSASASVIYAITTILSFLTMLGYCCLIKKRDAWFLLLFASVVVVNIGYFALASSNNLEEALLANRIAYLGSVFLPTAMFMIISKVSGVSIKNWLPPILIVVSALVFLVAASPGYANIYYKSVSFEKVNGVAMLVKEYGKWHVLYLVYLLSYFAVMVFTAVRAIQKKKISSAIHGVVLIIAVTSNIGVWLLEQFVKVDFEFLSISYIISEMFLLGLYMMIQNQEKQIMTLQSQIESLKAKENTVSNLPKKNDAKEIPEHCRFLKEHISSLTATERIIYDFYLEGKGTKDIMAKLNISENTLKYHNKNIYSKLGVSSRKQLIEYSK